LVRDVNANGYLADEWALCRIMFGAPFLAPLPGDVVLIFIALEDMVPGLSAI